MFLESLTFLNDLLKVVVFFLCKKVICTLFVLVCLLFMGTQEQVGCAFVLKSLWII